MKNTVSIKNNREFVRVYKKGKFFAGKYIVLYILQNGLKINRLGITASKKTGNSVKRNRIKRLIRENYRLIEETVKSGCDLVFVVRSSSILPDFYMIKKEINYLMRKLNVTFDEKNHILEEL